MMILKSLSSKDAIKYQRLRLNALKENPIAFGSSYEEESIKDISFFESRLDDALNITWGVFYDARLVGILTMRISDRVKTKHNGHLAAMYVDQNFRRKGIGKMLLNEAILYAKSHGIINLFLTVTKDNHEAIKLYEHIGFKTYGIEEREIYFNNTYYDSYLMAYYL